MKYLNQLEHEHVPYPTNMQDPESDMAKNGNIARAGCGLCSLCMVVDQLTMKNLPLQKCIDIAIAAGSNMHPGTDMKKVAPIIAEKYGLTYSKTDDIKKAVQCLRDGGRVIVNVGGDREEEDGSKYIGVFSHGGHYITLISATDDEICVLDPSWKPEKFMEDGRHAVRVDGKFVYTPYDVLDKDASNRTPRYHLFKRK